GRPETQGRGGRGRGGGDGERPVAQEVQGDARRLPRAATRLLHPAGSELPVHEQPGALRPASARVFATTGASSLTQLHPFDCRAELYTEDKPQAPADPFRPTDGQPGRLPAPTATAECCHAPITRRV